VSLPAIWQRLESLLEAIVVIGRQPHHVLHDYDRHLQLTSASPPNTVSMREASKLANILNIAALSEFCWSSS
jgi:hypothetical protein